MDLDANGLSYWLACLVPVPARSGISQPQPVFQEGFAALSCELTTFKVVFRAARGLTSVIFKAANGESLTSCWVAPLLSYILGDN